MAAFIGELWICGFHELPNRQSYPPGLWRCLHHLLLAVRLMLWTGRSLRFFVTFHAALHCATDVLLHNKCAPVSVKKIYKQNRSKEIKVFHPLNKLTVGSKEKVLNWKLSENKRRLKWKTIFLRPFHHLNVKTWRERESSINRFASVYLLLKRPFQQQQKSNLRKCSLIEERFKKVIIPAAQIK